MRTKSTLPQNWEESETVVVDVKNKLSYKHAYRAGNIRPARVIGAIAYLLLNSPLYEDVEYNRDWMGERAGRNEQGDDPPTGTDTNSDTSESEEDYHHPDYNQADAMVDNEDTALTLRNKAIALAPGEGQTPMGLWRDADSQYLAFPDVYGGRSHAGTNARTKVFYAEDCKHQLFHSDRRAARNPELIFFMLRRYQVLTVLRAPSVRLRKGTWASGKRFTLRDVVKPGFLEGLCDEDQAFRDLEKLRGSPDRMEADKKAAFAMARQEGKPTFFMTVQDRDYANPTLLSALSELVDGVPLSPEQVEALEREDRFRFIREEPVVTAMYYMNCIRGFFKDVLLKCLALLGGVVDFFGAHEVQQRGAFHTHMALYTRQAPIYGVHSDEEVCRFIDEHITCSATAVAPDLVKLQYHRHFEATCNGVKGNTCRFRAPWPPMPHTTILTPLEDDDPLRPAAQDMWASIYKYMDTLGFNKGDTRTFQEFLEALPGHPTMEQYIAAVRTSIDRDTVFLKRAPSEIRINGYNPSILKMTKANMDLQYVLDTYAALMYIVNYMMKGKKGVTKVLDAACKEARRGNLGIKQRLRQVGNAFLNAHVRGRPVGRLPVRTARTYPHGTTQAPATVAVAHRRASPTLTIVYPP